MFKICELGPRDGLQVYRNFVSTTLKVKLIDALSFSGLKEIHIAYFAHPKVIPQMKDAENVASNIKRNDNVKYIGFVPNEVGLRRALNSNVDRISFFISAEESLNLVFFKKTTETLLQEFIILTKEALKEGKEVEAFIVRAFEKENFTKACRLANSLIKAGVSIIYFSNFGIKMNNQLFKKFLKDYLYSFKDNNIEIGLHLYLPPRKIPTALSSAIEIGVKRFATSIGGLGLRKIDGDIVSLPPTELLVRMLHIKDIDLKEPLKIVQEIGKIVERIGTL